MNMEEVQIHQLTDQCVTLDMTPMSLHVGVSCSKRGVECWVVIEEVFPNTKLPGVQGVTAHCEALWW